MDKLSLLDTQIAIKYLKDHFEALLAKKLNLTRVSAPLFVEESTGLNDNLNGVEESVHFEVGGKRIEIVHSLAKWKRHALKEYGFPLHSGLYTDMNAIRKDETMDPLHSIYVDQWDWEKVIAEEDRTLSYLFRTVSEIYSVIRQVAKMSQKKWGYEYNLPKTIARISTKQLEKRYPDKTPKEREYLFAKEHRAIFIYQIGWPLKNGLPHDGRSADYDDWKLNGDIIVFDDEIDAPLELSSMGIRVDAESLKKQLAKKGESKKLANPYCQAILQGKLPFTIGGGIGQSRLCMYYLQKKHIGEVQASYWPKEMKEKLLEEGLDIL
ncbi:MAG: aspartate--ammonia ligase [Bacilli bacterium]|nr:aspartate--ammonia ligase [Bacilli bacterium]